LGEARRRMIQQSRIRNGEFPCIYCGGVVPGTEPDHMPPRILFNRKQRPNDLVFPSCSACNRGSAPIDTVIAWLARMYPNSSDPLQREEVRALGASMATNFPEVATAFRQKNNVVLTPHQRAALTGEAVAIDVSDPYVQQVLKFFGAKFGMAMHWWRTGRFLPPEGRVYPMWFTNYQAITGLIPSELFKVFPDPTPLMQGRMHTAGRFEYASQVAGNYSTHLAVFGHSYLILAFVAPFPEPTFAGSGHLECEPGCLKVGYPYGLPSLSSEEIQARLDSDHQ
jgi:hypothetical protein